MRRKGFILLALAWATGPATAYAEPADVAAAVMASGVRTEANVQLDEGRKPAQLLSFLGLEKGMRVIDMVGANRYWAEIIAPAVGPHGHVTVWQPKQFLSPQRKSEFEPFAAAAGNVTLLTSPFENPLLGSEAYDFMIMNLDYHDVYWENAQRGIVRMDPDSWLKKLYAAMKPGAVVGIIDHVAAAGADTRTVVDKLHRIDPAVVRADFERAGFVLEAESDLLRNPADDHSLLVFDPAIRNKTDRFLYRFRKPA